MPTQYSHYLLSLLRVCHLSHYFFIAEEKPGLCIAFKFTCHVSRASCSAESSAVLGWLNFEGTGQLFCSMFPGLGLPDISSPSEPGCAFLLQ